ncbi:restriction endonuclease subunit S [Phascolarctobacterium sp.]|uniref:restriction endonuclease subunit S n=1 Tax=Phascolarctobacterium sp. TaxID=2049039 RepID=UPI00386959D4
MKKYETYKQTHEAIWFDSIPENWVATKMRKIFAERREKVSDKDYPPLSVGKMGIVPQLDTAVKTDNGDNRKLICIGDFAINSRSDRKGSGGMSQYNGSASLIITVLKPRYEVNVNFYHYLLRSHYFSEEFYRNGKGLVSDLWTTKWEEMKNIYIPVPPREEQDQIVRYLDWQASKINHLIHGYQKQIKLLEERKKKQTNDVLKEGLEIAGKKIQTKAIWMGKTPSHWMQYRVKDLMYEVNDRSKDGSEPHLSMSQKYGLVTDDVDIERRLLSESYVGAKLCEMDDLVLNRLKAHLGVFALAPQLGVVSPDYTVLRIKRERIIPKYAEYLLKCNGCRRELVIRVRGIVEGFWRLYTNDLYSIYMCVPSLEEQKHILEFIGNAEEKYKNIKDKLEKEIQLLKEYKIRLISDVVTGQIDVRDVVIPEYTPEEDIELDAEAAPDDAEEVAGNDE